VARYCLALSVSHMSDLGVLRCVASRSGGGDSGSSMLSFLSSSSIRFPLGFFGVAELAYIPIP
jgi:hypothetical protein